MVGEDGGNGATAILLLYTAVHLWCGVAGRWGESALPLTWLSATSSGHGRVRV
jgi:hypothetical protein